MTTNCCPKCDARQIPPVIGGIDCWNPDCKCHQPDKLDILHRLRRSTERSAAVAMLKAGEATLSEVAVLAGVTRQGARWWALQEHIDAQAARAARLEKIWNNYRLGR